MSNKEDKKVVQHPKALYFCGSIYSFVNFAYYGMKLILILFLAEQIKKGGLGLSDAEAASLLATFMAWAYLSPVFGGWISDRFLGPKRSVQIGTLIVSIGYFIGYIATNKTQIYLMIILAVIGSGFYKGNLNTLVGSLYPKSDTRKDAAFSLTYTFTNVGVLLGPLVCGLIANEWFATKSEGEIQVYGYKYVFLVVAIAAFLGFLIFTIGQKKFLSGIEKSENKKEELERRKELAKKPLTNQEKKRMIVILILAFFTVFFWMAYNQASMSIALYTQQHVNLNLGSFVIPTSWIDSYNGLLCVILGPIMAAIWVKLSQTKKGDLNIAQKMSLGFLFLAAGFLFIITAVNISGTSSNSTVKASILWIVLFITFQSIGEMCFSPIGYGMVDRLAPEKYSALFMGIWFGSIFVANKLSGYVQTIIDDLGMKTVFMGIPIFLGVLGILLFILNKKLEQMAE